MTTTWRWPGLSCPRRSSAKKTGQPYCRLLGAELVRCLDIKFGHPPLSSVALSCGGDPLGAIGRVGGNKFSMYALALLKPLPACCQQKGERSACGKSDCEAGLHRIQLRPGSAPATSSSHTINAAVPPAIIAKATTTDGHDKNTERGSLKSTSDGSFTHWASRL